MLTAVFVLMMAALIAQQPASAPAATPPATLDFEFYRTRVEPILTRDREGPSGRASCAACHSAVATRLRLQPLPAGASSWTLEQSRQNFESATLLVAPGEPQKSRLLLHPLATEAGGDPSHTGGKFWKSQEDQEWQTLAAWVRTASATTASRASSTVTLDYEFFKTRVQPLFVAKRAGLVRCTQCHSRGTGSGFQLQPLAEGVTTWNEEQSRKNFESASRLVAPGSPTASRLLMHPLARTAGGDPFHGGGKHWNAQNDAEWQILAAWARGDTLRGSAR